MIAALLAVMLAQGAAAEMAAPRSQAELKAEAVKHALSKPLSPQADAALRAFRAELLKVRARHAAAGPSESVAGEFARRVELEQTARRALDFVSVEGPDMNSANTLAWAELEAVDAANTAYLKQVLPADGWFRNSRDGAETAHHAWVIVQHSPDMALMKAVLARMTPLVRQGEVSGPDYARLYDRMAMFENRPQRFGTQFSCSAGKWAYHPIEAPEGVDGRRQAMGLESTLAEHAKLFSIGSPCP